MQNNAPIVKFENVCLSYPGVPTVFSDVSFRLTSGSFTFLTGASGAGKTSLMKLIYLALKPTNGNISLFGYDIDQLAAEHHPMIRRRIGIVLQEFDLIDHLSVFENVALPLRIRGLKIKEYTRDIIELLDWVGLGHRVDAEPAVLSGGEKQRVCIARAVITRPDLILADEPTGNVDPEMAERLLRLFAELNKLGATILIATHDYSLMKRFKANILKLSEGSLWGIPSDRFDNEKGPLHPENMDIMPDHLLPEDGNYNEHHGATLSVKNVEIVE
ncbi:MAG: ATP-binding cassette domain-containing protein [Pseudomonadota bacterium]